MVEEIKEIFLGEVETELRLQGKILGVKYNLYKRNGYVVHRKTVSWEKGKYEEPEQKPPAKEESPIKEERIAVTPRRSYVPQEQYAHA